MSRRGLRPGLALFNADTVVLLRLAMRSSVSPFLIVYVALLVGVLLAGALSEAFVEEAVAAGGFAAVVGAPAVVTGAGVAAPESVGPAFSPAACAPFSVGACAPPLLSGATIGSFARSKLASRAPI